MKNKTKKEIIEATIGFPFLVGLFTGGHYVASFTSGGKCPFPLSSILGSVAIILCLFILYGLLTVVYMASSKLGWFLSSVTKETYETITTKEKATTNSGEVSVVEDE